MATIRPNDNAPAEEMKVILPTATFDLSQGGTYETDDRNVLADAEAHPFLTVEHPEQDAEAAVTRESDSVPYADDYLAAPNSKAFDTEEVQRVESDKREDVSSRLAVDAGLNQSKAETVGEGDHEIAVTLAADDSTDDKPARKSAAKKGD